MATVEELRSQLAELQKARQEAEEKLQAQRKHPPKGMTQVECSGTSYGPCPHKAFEFKKKREEWHCNACWKVFYKPMVRIVDTGGYTKEFLARQKLLDKHTLRFEEVLHHRIRINFKGEPWLDMDGSKIPDDVLDKYALRGTTESTVPAGYFWCKKNAFPWKKIKRSCRWCSFRNTCVGFTLARKRHDVKVLRKKLAALEEPDKISRHAKRENRKLLKQQKLERQKIINQAILDKYSKVTIVCGECATDLSIEPRYWINDGSRWVVVTPDFPEKNARKRRCHSCYRKGKT